MTFQVLCKIYDDDGGGVSGGDVGGDAVGASNV